MALAVNVRCMRMAAAEGVGRQAEERKGRERMYRAPSGESETLRAGIGMHDAICTLHIAAITT